ncbi:hypothetical protein B0H16DRAFT_1467811 [Mycena metata]|uniref:Uncharacterized protein n=1 Tax=Mycena metata TaxID=1033252 RepID=A0AAD7I4H5_9AGAR|nr:hypothetical protein B0H16DRAFT_1467811 [Mycena metata]
MSRTSKARMRENLGSTILRAHAGGPLQAGQWGVLLGSMGLSVQEIRCCIGGTWKWCHRIETVRVLGFSWVGGLESAGERRQNARGTRRKNPPHGVEKVNEGFAAGRLTVVMVTCPPNRGRLEVDQFIIEGLFKGPAGGGTHLAGVSAFSGGYPLTERLS